MTPSEQVRKAVIEALKGSGFRRWRQGVLVAELGPGVFGWLGLNTAREHYPKGVLEVNPVVGVRHDAVEREIEELALDGRATPAPTVSTPIGYVMPQRRYRAWVLEPGDPTFTPAVAEMVTTLKTYGLEFMRSALSLEGCLQRVREGFSAAYQDYREPVLLMLLGRRDDAHQLLQGCVDKRQARTDPEAETYRRFASRLLSRIGGTGSGKDPSEANERSS
jgi:hypothetical protein